MYSVFVLKKTPFEPTEMESIHQSISQLEYDLSLSYLPRIAMFNPAFMAISRGVTAGSLWHAHGFVKLVERMEARDLHSVLSPLWGKIHGSQVVDVKIIYDEVKTIKYSVKDAVKKYLSDDHYNKRLFQSRGWLPEGYRKVDKLMTKWALLHTFDWDIEESEPDQGYEPRLDYIPFVWEVKRDYLKRWCRGESVSLDLGDYKVYILGESITKYAVLNEGGDIDELL